MKRILVLLLSLCLALPVFCAAEETIAYTWSNANAAAVSGSFVTLDGAGMQMLLPSDFISYPLSESEVASGLMAYCMTEDGEQVIAVRFLTQLPEGLTENVPVSVNGMEGLLGHDPSTDAICLLLPTEDGRYVQFSFQPADTMKELSDILISSIQKIR